MAPPDDFRQPLSPPRFRLRTLLIAVGLLCVLLAVITTLNPYGVFAAIMLVLTVIAHFVGAAIGHRLRDLGSQPLSTTAPAEERFRPVETSQFAPRGRLGQHRGPGRLVLWLTVIWAVLGGGAGAALLIVVNGERANVTNVASGAAAFAVLGAIWGFALASFLKETLIAWWEAQRTK
jgi:hypothetical protein